MLSMENFFFLSVDKFSWNTKELEKKFTKQIWFCEFKNFCEFKQFCEFKRFCEFIDFLCFTTKMLNPYNKYPQWIHFILLIKTIFNTAKSIKYLIVDAQAMSASNDKRISFS